MKLLLVRFWLFLKYAVLRRPLPRKPKPGSLEHEYRGDWAKLEADLPRLIATSVIPRLREQMYGGVRFSIDLLTANKSRDYHAAVRVLQKFLAQPRPEQQAREAVEVGQEVREVLKGEP